MRAALQLEVFGDNLRAYVEVMTSPLSPGLRRMLDPRLPRPWVAEILGRDPRFGMKRRFLRPKKDYTHSNGAGSRGIYLHYLLDSGQLYEVQEQLSWRKIVRRFVRVTETGDIKEVTREEVDALCRSADSGSTSSPRPDSESSGYSTTSPGST